MYYLDCYRNLDVDVSVVVMCQYQGVTRSCNPLALVMSVIAMGAAVIFGQRMHQPDVAMALLEVVTALMNIMEGTLLVL